MNRQWHGKINNESNFLSQNFVLVPCVPVSAKQAKRHRKTREMCIFSEKRHGEEFNE
jgi:hypothetical protein